MLLMLALGTFVGPGHAEVDMDAVLEEIEGSKRCKEWVQNGNYAEQYDHGATLARVYNTVRKQKWWTAEERREFDPRRATSRHGLGGMSGQAEVAWMMWDAKREKRPFKPDLCIMSKYSILEEQAWSPVHEGFYEYLEKDAQKIYFSLPAR